MAELPPSRSALLVTRHPEPGLVVVVVTTALALLRSRITWAFPGSQGLGGRELPAFRAAMGNNQGISEALGP